MAEKEKNPKKKKFLKIFWYVFGAGLLLIVLLFFMIGKGWIGYMPPIDELQNPKNKFATEIYSSDLEVLGRFYYKENRVGVNYGDLSPALIEALIATEDIRYYDHSGIDGKALVRAFALLGKAGGGSTITQQLAKQLYSPSSENVFQRSMRKPIEWVIAVQLERIYSKDEIITMYLNQFDFLNNAVGIKSAAQTYFGIAPADLKIEEAALLIGMCKNPSLYNPVRFTERSQNRRNVVLHQMVKADYLTRQQFDSLKQLPVQLQFQRLDHQEGLAAYLREYLRQTLTAKEPKQSNYADWQQAKFKDDLWQWENNPLYGFFEKNKKSDGSTYNIYTDGLKIYTTIDSRMQRYAEEAVNEHMKTLQEQFFKEKKGRKKAPYSNSAKDDEIERSLNRAIRQSERYRRMKQAGVSESEIRKSFNTKTEMQVYSYNGSIDTIMTPMDSIRYEKHFLRTGFMSMDPKSGHVKAYVGGTDFSQFKYDMATQGRRQVGSTIKPFLYTLAMEEGMAPCDEVVNQSITLIAGNGRPWTPRNASKSRVGEVVTLRWGLANSNNWISAYLMSLFTPQSLADLMRSFGIRGEIVPDVSLCLGPCEVSVEEMVDAYTSFPNNGIRVDPLYVTRIEDANGNVIASFTPKMHEIFNETTAYKMIYMMRGIVDGGTGSRIRRYGLRMPAAGKTGTTNDNADGWFIGYTPSLVSGVWVGGEERDIHFDTMVYGQGASMALPIWALYMKKVIDDQSLGYSQSEQFDVPASFNPNADCMISSSSEGEEE